MDFDLWDLCSFALWAAAAITLAISIWRAADYPVIEWDFYYYGLVACSLLASPLAVIPARDVLQRDVDAVLADVDNERCAPYLTSRIVSRRGACPNLKAYRLDESALDKSKKPSPQSLQPYDEKQMFKIKKDQHWPTFLNEWFKAFLLVVAASVVATIICWAIKVMRRFRALVRAAVDEQNHPQGVLLRWEDIHVEGAGFFKPLAYSLILPALFIIGALGAIIFSWFMATAYKPPNRPSDAIFYVAIAFFAVMAAGSAVVWRWLNRYIMGGAWKRHHAMAASAVTGSSGRLYLRVTLDGKPYSEAPLAEIRSFALETYANHYGGAKERPLVYLILADIGRGETVEVAQSYAVRADMAQLMARFIEAFLEGPVAEAVAQERERRATGRTQRSPAVGRVDDVI